MTRFLHILFIGLLLAGLSPRFVESRVFRVTGDTRGQLNTAGLPWEQAYTTVMTVNGRRNEVVVFSARYNEPVIDQLKAQFERQGAKVNLQRNPDGGAIGAARWEDGEARFLVVSPGNQPNRLVFLFYPENGAPGRPQFPVPEYPRGERANTVSNDDTDTHCTTTITMDSVMQVQRYYAETLAHDGWAPALPLQMAHGLSYYRKKEKTCCVLASRNKQGETVVTLLVRDAAF